MAGFVDCASYEDCRDYLQAHIGLVQQAVCDSLFEKGDTASLAILLIARAIRLLGLWHSPKAHCSEIYSQRANHSLLA